MTDLNSYIDSGVIELYVLGMTNPGETEEVERLAEIFYEVKEAIDLFSRQIEEQVRESSIHPPANVKPMLLASLNYIHRISNGEPFSFPPLLSENAKVSDYHEWLVRPDMQLLHEVKNLEVKLIAHTPKVTTAIVWIKEMAPEEIHENEYERFLIVEGTCNITIDQKVHQLVPGDYMQIPLFAQHYVTVTSAGLCKIILQRVAA